MAAKKLKQIIDSAGRSNVLQKRQLYVVKELNKKLATENAIITQQSSLKLCTYKPPGTLIGSDSTICCIGTTVSS